MELKPCPFCGRKKGLNVMSEEISREFKVSKYFVRCPNCYTRGPKEYTSDKCVDAWNVRK